MQTFEKGKIITTQNVDDTSLNKLSKEDTGFFGQPKQLATLFSVETWERFSFYSVQAILFLYITYKLDQGGLGLDSTTGKSITGAYGGLVYLTCILFGWISDRVLGREKTLLITASIVMLGHLAMAFFHGIPGLMIGLFLIAFGSGGVKTSASSMVGSLYKKNDVRRDAGFTLYYFGVNIGAFLGPLVAGLLMDMMGFHWAFGAAAIGMAIGLVFYIIQRKGLPEVCNVPTNPLTDAEKPKAIAYAVGGVVILVGLGIFVATSPTRLAYMGSHVSNFIIGAALIGAIALFSMMLTSKKSTAEEKSRVVAFIPLFLSTVMFWALYQQIFTMLPDYAETKLNRSLFGWDMPIAWVNSISALYVIIFAVVFSAMWMKMGKRQPSTPAKFAFANVLIGVAYLLFIPVANVANNTAPLLWIMFILLLFCFAELCISPIGLSVATKLAPAKFATTMMALYFLASAIGTALSGTLATFYDPAKANNIPYFLALGIVSIVVGLIVVAISPFVKKKMAGIH